MNYDKNDDYNYAKKRKAYSDYIDNLSSTKALNQAIGLDGNNSFNQQKHIANQTTNQYANEQLRNDINIDQARSNDPYTQSSSQRGFSLNNPILDPLINTGSRAYSMQNINSGGWQNHNAIIQNLLNVANAQRVNDYNNTMADRGVRLYNNQANLEEERNQFGRKMDYNYASLAQDNETKRLIAEQNAIDKQNSLLEQKKYRDEQLRDRRIVNAPNILGGIKNFDDLSPQDQAIAMQRYYDTGAVPYVEYVDPPGFNNAHYNTIYQEEQTPQQQTPTAPQANNTNIDINNTNLASQNNIPESIRSFAKDNGYKIGNMLENGKYELLDKDGRLVGRM